MDVVEVQVLLGAEDPAPWWVKGGASLVIVGLFVRGWWVRRG